MGENNEEKREAALFEGREGYAPLAFDFAALNRFFSAITRRDRMGAWNALHGIFETLSAQPEADPDLVRSVCCVLWCLEDPDRRDHAAFPEPLRRPESLSAMQRFLLAQLPSSVMGHRSVMWEGTQERQRPSPGPGRAQQSGGGAAERAVQIIQERYGDKDLTVGYLAKRVYLTPTYLSGLFKKRTGKTIRQYITEVRIERSMELLMNKQLKISRVAETVGFSSADYLSKVFKRYVGMLPTEYRDRYASWEN